MRKSGFGSFRAPAFLASAADNNMQIVIEATAAWELAFISAVAYSTLNPYPIATDLARPIHWRMAAVVGEVPTNCSVTPLGDQYAQSGASIQREILNIIGQPSAAFMATFPKGGGPIIAAGEKFTALMGMILNADGTTDPNTVCHLTVWGRALTQDGGLPDLVLR